MKTNYVPAIVMLLAGAVYCLFGIRENIELLDFTIQLLIVLVVFYILGGAIRMFLDRFMGEVQIKTETDDTTEPTEESDKTDAEDKIIVKSEAQVSEEEDEK